MPLGEVVRRLIVIFAAFWLVIIIALIIKDWAG